MLSLFWDDLRFPVPDFFGAKVRFVLDICWIASLITHEGLEAPWMRRPFTRARTAVTRLHVTQHPCSTCVHTVWGHVLVNARCWEVDAVPVARAQRLVHPV